MVGRYYMDEEELHRRDQPLQDRRDRNTRPRATSRRRCCGLTECYMALGIVDEAQTAAAVLGHNFPDSRWYRTPMSW